MISKLWITRYYISNNEIQSLPSRFPDTHSRFSDVTPLIPASVSALPPPVPASAVPGAEEAADKSEGERSIDLDTRLQMLMKGKASNMPAFLMGSSGAETSDNEQERVFVLNNKIKQYTQVRIFVPYIYFYKRQIAGLNWTTL